PSIAAIARQHPFGEIEATRRRKIADGSDEVVAGAVGRICCDLFFCLRFRGCRRDRRPYHVQTSVKRQCVGNAGCGSRTAAIPSNESSMVIWCREQHYVAMRNRGVAVHRDSNEQVWLQRLRAPSLRKH